MNNTLEISKEIVEEIGIDSKTYNKVIKVLQCIEVNSESSETKENIRLIRQQLQSFGTFKSNSNLFED